MAIEHGDGDKVYAMSQLPKEVLDERFERAMDTVDDPGKSDERRRLAAAAAARNQAARNLRRGISTLD